MTTSSSFEINGVIDTANNVFDNVNQIATAAGAFVAWDPSVGKWSVTPNAAGPSVYSFNDSNILGSINVQGSGVDQLYNSVTLRFPHKDLLDTPDFVDFVIPNNQRFAQELDNRLNIDLGTLNDPVQAQLIASRELKQSRVDKIVSFATHYVGNNLNAGDLIDITTTMYGYVNKVFRIITIEETDDPGAGIVYQIQALEYDLDVYSTAGLVREERNKETGIIPEEINEPVQQSKNAQSSDSVASSLVTTAGIAAITRSIRYYADDQNRYTDVSIPILQSDSLGISPSLTQEVFATGNGNNNKPAAQMRFDILRPCKNLFINFEGPQGTINYTVDGVSKTILAGVPAKITLNAVDLNNGAPLIIGVVRYMEWSTYVTSFNLSLPVAAAVELLIQPLNTYDLNATNNFVQIDSVTGVFANGKGDGMTASVTAFL
jgi:hypothetical protein